MGEVYRAHDTSLGRDVAMKVLPDAFAHDAQRRARFQREAKTLASLNHPNIAIVHGLEQTGDVHALVMELVEGDDLSQRIARGAIPLDEALPIAKQIAEALEAAHDHGIVTGAGMILGTAAYMSPEQARGSAVDRRADVWAFGVVLYEMLTGHRLFAGPTVGDTLAQVLEREPDVSRLPANTPVAIRRLVRRCLVKDRKERLQHIGDARLEINEALTTPAPEAIAAAPSTLQAAGWRRTLPWVAAMIERLRAAA